MTTLRVLALGLLLVLPTIAHAEAPSIVPISDTTLSAGSGWVTVNLIATDTDWETITLTSTLPSFAVLNPPTTGRGILGTTITLHPLSSDAGTYNASVTATTGSESSSEEFTITILPAGSNAPPTLTAPSLLQVRAMDPLSFFVTVADPDQDAITSLTASGLPAGATFMQNGTNTSGTVNWIPTSSQTGSHDIVFTASNALSSSVTTHIHVFQDGNALVPWFSGLDDVTVREGESILVNVTLFNWDRDSTTLSASALPPFATLNPLSATVGAITLQTTITVTPGAGDAGSYPVELTATSFGGCGGLPFCSLVREQFTITVLPAGSDRPPVVTAPDLKGVRQLNPLTFNVTVADPDQDPITSLTASGLPPGATFTPDGTNTSGTFTWTPPIQTEYMLTLHDVVFTASNALSSSATTLVVVAEPLVFLPIEDVTVSEGGLATVKVYVQDFSIPMAVSASGLPPFARLNSPTSSSGFFALETTITITPGAGTAGVYPVTLTAMSTGDCDIVPSCVTKTQEFTITVTSVLPDFETVASLIGKFQSHKRSLCFRIRQDGTPFDLADVDPESITLAFEGRTAQALAKKARVGDTEACEGAEDCGPGQLRVCFSMEAIRSLLDGHDLVTGLSNSEIHGALDNGQTFVADVDGTNLADGPGQDKMNLKLRVRPNPMNPATELQFSLARPGIIRISLYDVRGRLVKTILDESRPAGDHVIPWDGSRTNGGGVASGIYFLKIQAEQGEEVQRVTVLK